MYNVLCCDILIVVFLMFVEKFFLWIVYMFEGMSFEIIMYCLNYIGWGMVGG